MMYMNLLADEAGIYIILKIRCSLHQGLGKPLKTVRFSSWVAGVSLTRPYPVLRQGTQRSPLPDSGVQVKRSSVASLHAALWMASSHSTPLAGKLKSGGQIRPTVWSSSTMRYDWHTKYNTYLTCTVWWIQMYAHTCEATTTIKVTDISSTSTSFLVSLLCCCLFCFCSCVCVCGGWVRMLNVRSTLLKILKWSCCLIVIKFQWCQMS